jgi:hypothetical protein
MSITGFAIHIASDNKKINSYMRNKIPTYGYKNLKNNLEFEIPLYGDAVTENNYWEK